jgi:multidrug efflux pump subunit AcrA (membrane-fusion protein)
MKIFWFLGPSDPDHQREDLSGVLRGSRWALWSLLLTCVVFFTWAYFAEIDQITRAPGSVISSARSQIIQSQDGGVIEELMVREGDVVQRDQVLVKIDGTRQQGLTRTGRADQQRALGDLAAKAAEFLRVAQEFDDFFQLVLGFVDPGDIVKRDAPVLFGQQLGLGFAKAHRAPFAAPLHAVHEENPHADKQDERQPHA